MSEHSEKHLEAWGMAEYWNCLLQILTDADSILKDAIAQCERGLNLLDDPIESWKGEQVLDSIGQFLLPALKMRIEQIWLIVFRGRMGESLLNITKTIKD